MTRSWLFLMLIFFTLTGCIGGNNYRATTLSLETPVQTFVWAQPAPNATMPHSLHSPLLDGVMRAATVRALENRGLNIASPAEADLIVTYHALRLPAVPGAHFRNGPLGLGVYGPDFTWKYYFSNTTMVFHIGDKDNVHTVAAQDYYIHVLIVDVLDARTGQLIWRGWRQANSNDELLTLGKVPEAVNDILKDFLPYRAHQAI